ncbi:hypothetical protein BW730_12505 [Tessaracoccus aquimaris]|uniref:Gram-positive cocci surface proteins LPxTG domain-containing protein n=1 Tax=Tessaracoccus aquimaris TaxID=1332264 RepID=A0A1Q2CQ89_9ACTN|nr:isopeptide-forming domain-containing fimbrial protein [Tessaracoccus aquimaris]AQP48200.1 hypothetical protein BW730_12505 [Tessaracoccus aquimaris]
MTIDAAGVNNNAYIAPTATSGDNDFTRVAGNGNAQKSVSAAIPEGTTALELNALVYPTWSTDVIALNDPDGYDGKAIYTGTGPFDANDDPGNDSGNGNDIVRNGDVVNYNWSVVSKAELDTGSTFNGWFEQTLTPKDGAVVTFGELPTACVAATSTITALPSGTILQPRVAPPAGTTSVVLKCDLGTISEDTAQKTVATQAFVTSASPNGSSFDTSVRTYGATSDGVTTARPDGPEDFGPFKITAVPRYDLEKQRPWTYPLGQKNVNGVTKFGWEILYSVQISTDRKVGVEAFEQPVTFEDSLWGLSNDGAATMQPDFPWEITSCQPNTGNQAVGPGPTTVYGKIGGRNQSNNGNTTADDSVRDSGTCAFSRVGDPDTGNYEFTLSGIDASGATYPTKNVEGNPLPANKFYVASYAIKVFIPYEAIDAMDGIEGNGIGSAKLGNRVGNFDPTGLSGVSNYGTGNEPGYCQPGPNTDAATKCDKMPNNTQSNNVSPTLAELTISPGSWGKVLSNPRGTWLFRNAALPESANTLGDGAGQVQPGQTYASVITAKISLDTQNLQMCDVWDGSMMKLDLLRNIPGDNVSTGPVWNDLYSAAVEIPQGRADPDRAKMPAFQDNVTIKYAHVDYGSDDPNNGSFDSATNRWKGTWTTQKAAAGTNIACGNPNVTWYDNPADVPGGIDGVNAAWLQTKPGYTQLNSTSFQWMIGLQQRNTYYGGPHAGQEIPELTVAANFANLKSDTFGNWKPVNDYLPGAGNTDGKTVASENGSTMGDRWTLVRARLAITKHTIDGTVNGADATGASAIGNTGSAKAGTPVIWQIDPSLSAASDAPAPVDNVVVTDILPKGAEYDPAATAAIAGNTAPSSYTVNPDGTTTLVWNLGTRTPNQPLGPLKVVTHVDPLLPNNTSLTNKTEVRADGIVYYKSAHYDDHTVTVIQPGSLQLKKSVDQVLDLQDKDQVYTLQVRNFGETLRVAAPTIIDVLPYNGDATNDANVNRNPASDFAGTTKLDAPPQVFWFDGTTPATGTFYYTTIDPKLVPQDLNADTDPSIWSTTFTTDATAWKFVAAQGLDFAGTGVKSGLQFKFKMNQADNAAGDLYVNRFTAFSDTFKNEATGVYQVLTSNQVMVRVVGFSLGDLIWFDANNDGKLTPGVDTTAPEGVKVDVYKADGTLAGSVTTNKDGRWVINDLPEGDYYAVIPAAEFAAGGKLAGYVAQTVGYQADPNTDKNEGDDHNGAPFEGGMKTGNIHLSATVNGSTITGNEPLNDNTGNMPVTPGTTDGFTNFTLDMALKAVPGYEFTKTADPASGTDVVKGDTITYTVVGKNTGKTPLAVEITDDLAEVLAYAEGNALTGAPTATIGTTAAAAPTVDGTTLTWTGNLKPGETVTLKYTITVGEGHEGKIVNNKANSTATPPYDPPITPPEVVTEHPIPGYTFTKTADPKSGTDVVKGDTITYTLTGTNTGATALDPVVVNDDLTNVVAFADITTAPAAVIVKDGAETPATAPTVTDGKLVWNGKLAVGESVKITYTVTVKAGFEGKTINNKANSTATPPTTPPITPPEVTTEHPIPGYDFTKSANPASGTSVQADDTITYTLTGTNTGATALDPVVVNDDLTNVVAFADITTAPAAVIVKDGAETPATAPTVTDGKLVWNGKLAVGESVKITYTVTVKAGFEGKTINNKANSTATPPTTPPITPPEVTTEHPIPGYDFTKSADPKSGSLVNPGDTITYTLTGTNTGATALDPVVVNDDLSKVLDNATMTTAPAAVIIDKDGAETPATAPTVDGTKVAWTGKLAIGEKVVITYTVTINEGADKDAVVVNNHASSSATPPTGPPITPPDVTTEHPVPGYDFTKTSDPVSGTTVQPGGTITYTLTGTNTGATVLDPVVINDDLSKVLNNAAMTVQPVATIEGADSVPQPVVDGTKVTWTGKLEVGQKVVITYTVKVNEGTDKGAVVINNHASSEATPPTGPPITPPDVTTEHPVPGYDFTKTSDPVSGTAVNPGMTITYTLTGENTGATILDPVVINDDLSKVLDNAALTVQPVATIEGADSVPQPVVDGTKVTWTGKLEVGQLVVITYTVTLNDDAKGVVVNNHASSEATPPGEPPITPPDVTTEHPTPNYEFTKTSDPESGTAVNPGDTITYTVTGNNTGKTVLDPVVINDDMSKVLNNAKLTVNPVATIEGVDDVPQPTVEGTKISWTGKLEVGQKVVITYTVTLNDDAEGVIVNNHASSSATPPGLPPITPPDVEVWHPTPGYTFNKTADPVSGSTVVAGDTITYTLTGSNFGETVLDPVVINDDLANVTAHATLQGDPVATIVTSDGESEAAKPTLDGTKLTWTGTLQKGEQVVITYKVKVNEGQEGKIINNRASSTATPPVGPPITPPEVTTEHPIPGYTFTKTSDPKSGSTVNRGEKITYTLTGTNTGATVLDPVVVTDDLSKVLNVTTLSGAPVAKIVDADGNETAAAAPTLTGTTMSWKGVLQVGQKVVITYAVTVNSDAPATKVNNHAESSATPPGVPTITPPPVETEHNVPPAPVNPPKPPLPNVGSTVTVGLLVVAFAALLAGGVLVLRGRRRTHS